MESIRPSAQLLGNDNYWCHTCKKQVQTHIDNFENVQCNECQNSFCELMEQNVDPNDDDPESFEPFRYSANTLNDPENSIEALSLENSSQRNTSWSQRSPLRQQTPPRNFINNRNSNLVELPQDEEMTDPNPERVLTGAALQNNELVSRILDMALQRIRTNNTEFTNAVLTRAHIRIIGNNQQQPFRLRRLLPELASIYNNSPSGIFQDILEDLLEVPQAQPSSGGFFSNYFEQFIQQLSENDLNRFGPPPASKESIKLLKKIRIQEFSISNVECCVCQELFKNFDDKIKMETNEEAIEQQTETFVIEMPCTHQFHEECLSPWLDKHNSCPTCRYELPTDDPDYEQRKVQQRQRQSQQQQQSQNRGRQSNQTTERSVGFNGQFEGPQQQ